MLVVGFLSVMVLAFTYPQSTPQLGLANLDTYNWSSPLSHVRLLCLPIAKKYNLQGSKHILSASPLKWSHKQTCTGWNGWTIRMEKHICSPARAEPLQLYLNNVESRNIWTQICQCHTLVFYSILRYLRSIVEGFNRKHCWRATLPSVTSNDCVCSRCPWMVDFSLWRTESGQLFSLRGDLLSAGSPWEPQSDHDPAAGGTTPSTEGQIWFKRPTWHPPGQIFNIIYVWIFVNNNLVGKST